MGGTIGVLQSFTPPIFHRERMCKLLIFPIFQKEQKVVKECLESTPYHSFTPVYIDRKDVPVRSPALPDLPLGTSDYLYGEEGVGVQSRYSIGGN